MSFFEREIGKLGFGLMRLPKKDGVIDVETVKVMVDKFLEAGFNYFDTAWAYDGSEDAIRQALVERYPRESFCLATKNAAWAGCKTREEGIAQFETSLKRTGAGYFDFYLLHNLGQSRTTRFEELDMWSFVREMKEKGLIKHIGFSMHAGPEELDEVLTKHPEAEFVQLQINYADWENPSVLSGACYEVARKHGKPVVIMEPVKGGLLATPPEKVQEIMKNAEPEASYASWAVRFAANLDGVLTVLSGMSTVEQMEDNLAVMKDFKGFNEEQKKTVVDITAAMKSIPLIECTSCKYCAKVCPINVAIPDVFTAANNLTLYNNLQSAQGYVKMCMGRDATASWPEECLQCGACEEVCPQHLPIRELLEKAAESFPKP